MQDQSIYCFAIISVSAGDFPNTNEPALIVLKSCIKWCEVIVVISCDQKYKMWKKCIRRGSQAD